MIFTYYIEPSLPFILYPLAVAASILAAVFLAHHKKDTSEFALWVAAYSVLFVGITLGVLFWIIE